MKRKVKITPSITNRESETLRCYFKELGRIPLLTIEEETELARKSCAGDIEARNRLVSANLRFSASVAKQFAGHGVDLEDLISEASEGLIEAAERFDETKGFRFLSYAVNWVYQRLSQAVSNYGRMVRLPQNKLYGISKVGKASSRLEQTFHRLPTIEEVAEALELSVEVVVQLMQLSGRTVSLDAPVSPDSETTVEELLVADNYEPADKSLMRQGQETVVADALSGLPEIERLVLQMSFGIGTGRELTANEIGTKLNLSRERVRQIKDRACKRLRTKSGYEFLRQHFAA